MKIYANVDSDESISCLKNYDPHLIKIEISAETKELLNALQNVSIAMWVLSHNIEISSSLGEGIICGVTE